MTLELHKAAEQGDAVAQFNLGVLYYNGDGVPQDYKEAVEWLTKAAEQGFSDAQSKLGWMYLEGESVPQDYEKAAKWLLKSTKQARDRRRAHERLLKLTKRRR